jgi:hypothetical protein
MQSQTRGRRTARRGEGRGKAVTDSPSERAKRDATEIREPRETREAKRDAVPDSVEGAEGVATHPVERVDAVAVVTVHT